MKFFTQKEYISQYKVGGLGGNLNQERYKLANTTKINTLVSLLPWDHVGV